MLKNWTFVIMCLAIPGVLNAGDRDARLAGAVERIEHPIAPGAVSGISGFVGMRLKANTEGYLRLFDIDRRRQWIRVGRVNYSDGAHPDDFSGGLDPWPIETDGFDLSLSRIDPELYGNNPDNWQAAAPSPGTVNP